MEIRPGYKQEEAGAIPEDWESRSLRDIVDFTNGKPHEADVNEHGQYLLITLDSIGADGCLKTEHKRVRRHDGSLKKDDIVTVLSTVVSDLDQGNILGLCDLIREDNKYVLNQRMGRLRMTVDGSPRFVCLQMNRRRDHFKKRGQGTSQKHIYRRDVDSLVIPFPPSAEQHAIAEALNDVDGLLGGLGRLIDKKREVKQAVLQQLVTGQKRLPGFNGKWDLKRLGEIGKFRNGINKPKEDFGHGYPFANLMDVFGVAKVSNSHAFGLVNSTLLERELYELRKGDVLFVRSSVKPAGVGLTTLIQEDLPNTVFSGFLLRFRDDDRLTTEYKEHCFSEAGFRKRLIASSTVSANTNINQVNLRALTIKFPLDKAEQAAIAEVLADMDVELAALEHRREKTRALKQAMMQELLTGKTRLV